MVSPDKMEVAIITVYMKILLLLDLFYQVYNNYVSNYNFPSKFSSKQTKQRGQENIG